MQLFNRLWLAYLNLAKKSYLKVHLRAVVLVKWLASVLAFYSDNPNSNPTQACSFSVKFMFEKNEKNLKRPRMVHSEKE